MIGKISKIKNLGLVFCNYTWDLNLPVFKQFNLVYGWNGCGKTSFSRLFDAIGGAPIKDLEYEIEDEAGVKYKQNEAFPQKIRVFNQDYIQNNVKILESRANSISVLLGGENKELVEKIDADKKLLDGDVADRTKPGKIGLRAGLAKEMISNTSARDSKFTEIAKTIGAAIGGNALRDYRKPQAEKDFAALGAKNELAEDDLVKYLLSAKQESMPSLDLVELKKIKLELEGGELEIAEHLVSIGSKAKQLLLKTVEAEIISRLASNDDISNWVERGFHLHKQLATDTCEYCLQAIPKERVEQLARHFSDADKKLKEGIDLLLVDLKMIYPFIQGIQIPDKARLYAELRDMFDSRRTDFETDKRQLLADVTALAEELKHKKSKTTEALDLKTTPQTDNFSLRMNGMNELIEKHNKTTTDFETVKKAAIDKLKQHYLSTIYDEVKKYGVEILALAGKITSLGSEITEIQNRISENMAKISSKHKACEIINGKLATFLGHQELTFVPAKESGDKGKETVDGYKIMRGNKPAVFLSEGEKTAIAFVYFVVHLTDQEFKVSDGIIVVDDPISSLDSNSLYQAFSFLKNSVKDGQQVFILTHSFDFLKLLINWRRHAAGGTSCYMIKNTFLTNVRCAYITKLDKELSEYESEYHYLFKLLKQLRDEQDNSIARAYPVPNIARKVWETFLMFSVPNSDSPYRKMDVLKKAGRDEQKLDAIYKFTNDQSHITGAGFNPALVPETKKVVEELFEMMAEISPDHFKILDNATN